MATALAPAAQGHMILPKSGKHISKLSAQKQLAIYKRNAQHALYNIEFWHDLQGGSWAFDNKRYPLAYSIAVPNLRYHKRLLSNARRHISALQVKLSPPTPSGICWSCWDRVASCESGNNWHINTDNGFYGGLQFTYDTWLSAGGGRFASRADLASREQQIIVASRLSLSNWPVCGARY